MSLSALVDKTGTRHVHGDELAKQQKWRIERMFGGKHDTKG